MFELLCRTRFRHLLDSQHDPRGKGRRKHWNSNCLSWAKSQDFVSKYVLQRGVKIVDQLAEGLVSPQRFFFYWQRTRHHGGTTAELSSKLSRVLCGHVSFQNLPLSPLASCKHCNFSTAVQKAKSAKSCKQTCSPNSLRSNKAMWALRRWNEEWEEGGVVTQGGQQAQAVLSQPCQSFQGSASTDPSIIFFD